MCEARDAETKTAAPVAGYKVYGSLGERFKPAVLTIRSRGELIAAQANLRSKLNAVAGAKTAAPVAGYKVYGSLGERFKPAVLKTAEQKCSVSSNLTASASTRCYPV